MDTTLTDRYIAAALRTVPEEQRRDIAAELRTSIADQVDARTADGVPKDLAEREVLTDLGDPDRLAAEYTDRPLWLVGPRYYLDWLRLLKTLLWIVLPCAGIGVAIAKALVGASFGETAGSTVTVVLTAALHIAFWTTLVFVLLERTGHETMTTAEWTPDRLPEPRQSGAGLGDLVTNVAFLAITAGAVFWDHHVGFAPSHRGLSFLDPDIWPWWVAGLMVALGAEALLAIAVFARGRWTTRLAVTAGILNLAVAVPALWLLLDGRLLNAAFWPTLIADSADAHVVANLVTVVVGISIASVAVWDTIDAALKSRSTF